MTGHNRVWVVKLPRGQSDNQKALLVEFAARKIRELIEVAQKALGKDPVKMGFWGGSHVRRTAIALAKLLGPSGHFEVFALEQPAPERASASRTIVSANAVCLAFADELGIDQYYPASNEKRNVRGIESHVVLAGIGDLSKNSPLSYLTEELDGVTTQELGYKYRVVGDYLWNPITISGKFVNVPGFDNLNTLNLDDIKQGMINKGRAIVAIGSSVAKASVLRAYCCSNLVSGVCITSDLAQAVLDVDDKQKDESG